MLTRVACTLLLATCALANLSPVSLHQRHARHARLHQNLRRGKIETTTKEPSSLADGSLTAERGCQEFVVASKDDSCGSIVDSVPGLTIAGFINANPTINCKKPESLVNVGLCVAGPTTNLQFGSVGLLRGCMAFHLVKAKETCIELAEKYGISTSNFISLNVGIGADCLSMWKGSYVCVRAGGLSGDDKASDAHNLLSNKAANLIDSTPKSEPPTTQKPKTTSTEKATKTSSSEPKKTASSVKESGAEDEDNDGGSIRVDGQVTFYSQEGGGLACYDTSSCRADDEGMTVAIPGALFKSGQNCGKTVVIHGKSTVNLKVCDLCPSEYCNANHFDLTKGAARKVMGSDYVRIGLMKGLKYELIGFD